MKIGFILLNLVLGLFLISGAQAADMSGLRDCEHELTKLMVTHPQLADELSKFLQLRGQMALHRVAWGILRQGKVKTSEELEAKIRALLSEYHRKVQDSSSGKTIAAAFNKLPVSKVPQLSQLVQFEKTLSPEDTPYKLEAADLKYLGLFSQDGGGPIDESVYQSIAYGAFQGSHEEWGRRVEEKMTAQLESLQEELNGTWAKPFDLPIECFTVNANVACGMRTPLEHLGNSFQDLQHLSNYMRMELEKSMRQGVGAAFLGMRNGYYIPENVDQLDVRRYDDPRAVLNAAFHRRLQMNDRVLALAQLRTVTDDQLLQDWAQAFTRNQSHFLSQGKLYETKSGRVINRPMALLYDNISGDELGGLYKRTWDSFRFAEKSQALKTSGELSPTYTKLASLKLEATWPAARQAAFANMVIGNRPYASYAENGQVYLLDRQGNMLKGTDIKVYRVLKSELDERHLDFGPVPPLPDQLLIGHRVGRAVALAANEKYFLSQEPIPGQPGEYRWVSYDSSSGLPVTAPANPKASSDNRLVKEEIEEQELLNQSPDDKTLVKEWHQRYGKERAPCAGDTYSIVDKKNAKIQVFRHDGTLVWETNVLVGMKEGDMSTIWHAKDGVKKPKLAPVEEPTCRQPEKRERSGETNKRTGAGIYRVLPCRTAKDNPMYEAEFGSKLCPLASQKDSEGLLDGDEWVEVKALALHGIPHGMPQRNARIRDAKAGKPGNDRMSNGCINMLPEDFPEWREHTGPGCALYVLPENPLNHFRVSDGEIRLLVDQKECALNEDCDPDEKLSIDKFETAPRPVARKIKVTFAQGAHNTEITRRFLNPLVDGKPRLMKAYGFLTNDDYDMAVELAYGILGQESLFGESSRYKAKNALLIDLPIQQTIASRIREAPKDPVERAKWEEAIRKEVGPSNTRFWKGDKDALVSMGLTQIKQLPEHIDEACPDVNMHDFLALRDPIRAGCATMGLLAGCFRQMRGQAAKITANNGTMMDRDNIKDYLLYCYQGNEKEYKGNAATPDFNNYRRNAMKFSREISVSEEFPGAPKAMTTYEYNDKVIAQQKAKGTWKEPLPLCKDGPPKPDKHPELLGAPKRR